MFAWVLNRPLVLTDNHSISLILKLLKVVKKSSTHESNMNWLKNKWVTDAFHGFILFLFVVTAIYCFNPSNVELFVRNGFIGSWSLSILFARKMNFHFILGEAEIRERREKSFEIKSFKSVIKYQWKILKQRKRIQQEPV